tara:strand:- start:4962 stop:5951 length:990 start_codon:yes stop_codon:yes gene_type:complete
MVNAKYKFCVVYVTKDYYPMLDGCVYKYSKSNFQDVLVLNVDMGSSEKNLKTGNEICNKLGIHMLDTTATSMQEGLKIADEYISNHNIDIDWMISFQHDVFPLTTTFWSDLQNIIDDIDSNKVGMISTNSFSNYSTGIQATKTDNIAEACYGKTRTARGMLCKDVLQSPYSGWYMNLPNEYYQSKYFAVESTYWSGFAINRKLFQKYIEIDSNYVFELWGDDLAYQFLANGIVSIAVPKLFVCHDHSLKQGIEVDSGTLIEPRHDFNGSQMRFWKKWGFRWGIRNPEVRAQFNQSSIDTYNTNALQHEFFNLSINDGPLDIDLKSKAPQ